MASSNASVVVMVVLASSPSALAQPAEHAPSPALAAHAAEPSLLEVPPGYSSPMPRTRAEWEDMRSYLRMRRESAEKQLDTVRELGDPSWEEWAETELDARADAYKRFESRTMSRNPAAIAAGGTLIFLGLAGILLASNNAMNSDGPGEDHSDRWLALGIGGVVLLGAGIPLLVVGTRKTWDGPPDEVAASPRIVVGAGQLTVRRSF